MVQPEPKVKKLKREINLGGFPRVGCEDDWCGSEAHERTRTACNDAVLTERSAQSLAEHHGCARAALDPFHRRQRIGAFQGRTDADQARRSILRQRIGAFQSRTDADQASRSILFWQLVTSVCSAPKIEIARGVFPSPEVPTRAMVGRPQRRSPRSGQQLVEA